MTKEEARKVIDRAGGAAKFAQLLGIDGDPFYQQRVNNWRKRGIPARVVLANFALIQSLQRDPSKPV